MSGWTPRQRMLPRYQLTTRGIRADGQGPPQGTGTTLRASSAGMHSSRSSPTRATRHTSSAGGQRSSRGGRGVVVSSRALPEEDLSDMEFDLQDSVLFPRRPATLVHDVKDQKMTTHSARRNEGSHPTTQASTSSKPRVITTTPVFPITDPSNTDEYHRMTSPTPQQTSTFPITDSSNSNQYHRMTSQPLQKTSSFPINDPSKTEQYHRNTSPVPPKTSPFPITDLSKADEYHRMTSPICHQTSPVPTTDPFKTEQYHRMSSPIPPQISAFPITNPSKVDEYHRMTSPVPQQTSFPITDPSNKSQNYRMASTVPQQISPFPITDPSNMNKYHCMASQISSQTSNPRLRDAGASSLKPHPPQVPQPSYSGRRTTRRCSSGYGVASRRQVPVTNWYPFGKTPEVSQNEQSSPFSRCSSSSYSGDYKKTDLNTDKSRVTFSRNTKSAVTRSLGTAPSPCSVTHEDGSYLSHLRKAYLSNVRDLPKLMLALDLEKHGTIRERVEYDRKAGRILDYYSKIVIPTGVEAPHPPDVRQCLPVSSYIGVQQAHRSRSYGRRSSRPHTSSGFKDSTGTEFLDRHDGFTSPRRSDHSQSPVPDKGEFIKINAKACLHSRQHFYLRTPASRSNSSNTELLKSPRCVCGMCRLDMEVALMDELHHDTDVPVDITDTDHVRPSVAEVAMNHEQSPQSGMGVLGEGDHCSAKPDSVSHSRYTAAPPETHVSVSLALEPEALASQRPPSSLDKSTSTHDAPLMDSSSQTVTVPVTEDISGVTCIVHESKEVDVVDNDTKATETNEQSVLNNKDGQKISDTDFTNESVESAKQETPDSISKSVSEGEEKPYDSISDSGNKGEGKPSDSIGDSLNKEEERTSDSMNGSMKRADQETSDSTNEPVKKADQNTSDSVNNSVKKAEEETSVSAKKAEQKTVGSSDNSVKKAGQEMPDSTNSSINKAEQETSDSGKKAEEKTVDSINDSVNKAEQNTFDSINDCVKKAVQETSDSVKKVEDETSDSVKKTEQEPPGSVKKAEQEPSGSVKKAEQETSGSAKNTEQEPSGSAKKTEQEPPGSVKKTEQEPSDSMKKAEDETSDSVKKAEQETSDSISDSVKKAEEKTSNSINNSVKKVELETSDSVKKAKKETYDSAENAEEEASDSAENAEQETSDTINGSVKKAVQEIPDSVNDSVKKSELETTDFVRKEEQKTKDFINDSVKTAEPELSNSINDSVRKAQQETSKNTKQETAECKSIDESVMSTKQKTSDSISGSVNSTKEKPSDSINNSVMSAKQESSDSISKSVIGSKQETSDVVYKSVNCNKKQETSDSVNGVTITSDIAFVQASTETEEPLPTDEPKRGTKMNITEDTDYKQPPNNQSSPSQSTISDRTKSEITSDVPSANCDRNENIPGKPETPETHSVPEDSISNDHDGKTVTELTEDTSTVSTECEVTQSAKTESQIPSSDPLLDSCPQTTPEEKPSTNLQQEESHTTVFTIDLTAPGGFGETRKNVRDVNSFYVGPPKIVVSLPSDDEDDEANDENAGSAT